MNWQRKLQTVNKITAFVIVLSSVFLMSGCQMPSAQIVNSSGSITDEELLEIEYDGEPYVEINDNEPEFDGQLRSEDSFEEYGELDNLGRCTTALANLSEETLPEEDESRGDISSVHPSGWQSGQGWERCHLIAWCLSAENANERNLITGTHTMNVSAMLPFELEVVRYIERTGNHVLYEVEPVYDGNNLIASGVHMEAESVEDGGMGISFNIYCFNKEPGVEIDYVTGSVTEKNSAEETKSNFSRKYVLNTSSKKFHYPSCSSVKSMADHNKEVVTTTRQQLIDDGYEPCGMCEP